MKKTLIFALMCALVTLSACSKKDSNEPDEPQVVNNQDVQKVTFNVAPFQQTTEPMGNTPHRAPQAHVHACAY